MVKHLISLIRQSRREKRLKRKHANSLLWSFNIRGDVELNRCVIFPNVELRACKIDENSFVNKNTIVFSGNIGKYSSIGPGCQIGVPNHPIDHISTSPFIYSKDNSVLGLDTWEEYQSPPIIGNDVWIGSNVVVLQGVEIGDGAIIAAGAIVTKNVEPYTIVGGVPAKFIRNRFAQESIDYLLNLKWWDLPKDELKKHKELFESGSDWDVKASKLE